MCDELFYWIWLSSIPGIGSSKGRTLLDYFKTPKNIWQADEKRLSEINGLNRQNIEKLLDKNLRLQVEKHIYNIERNNIRPVPIVSSEYPKLLSQIYDPPLVLYTKGPLQFEKCIAIVGSRRATDYGLRTAKNLARDLASIGINVVSGFARGIDSKAHEGALEVAGATTAVLGCGLDIVYPPEGYRLMEKIISNGTIVSEYLPGFPPLPANFPARNRIISGLSAGVIVIEANERSGSLITVNFALEQGREVFAVPGNVNSLNSSGTNRLIKEGAKMVTNTEDVLEELRQFDFSYKRNQVINQGNKVINFSSKEEEKIYEELFKCNMHIDRLSSNTGISVKDLNSILIMMELSGKIEQLPGKIFKIK